MRALLLLAGLAISVSACGTKGPLTLPPKAAATQPAPTLADHSSKPGGVCA